MAVSYQVSCPRSIVTMCPRCGEQVRRRESRAAPSGRTWPQEGRSALIGTRIRELRQRRHLTQVVVAELSGHSERWLRRLESGHNDLRLRDVVSLAAVLRAEVEELTQPTEASS